VKCDGEYVDQNGNAQNCLDAISAWAAAINFSASGSATSSCSGGSCQAQAQGEASASCAVAPAKTEGSSGLFAFGLLGLVAAVRRRRLGR
jgi:MYXO-CTERM domain-containing protein